MSVAFQPIRTDRLILRPPRLNDTEAAYQRRSLPERWRVVVAHRG